MFSRFITRIIDHILFTVSFIAGVQVPAFIQQYIQVLNGKLAEAQYHLGKFQSVADQHYQGNLQRLVDQYIDNADAAIKQTGVVVSDLLTRSNNYQIQLNNLTESPYLEKLYYFFANIDMNTAQITVDNFQLSVPLTLEATSTGVVFGLLAVLIRIGVGRLFQRNKERKIYSTS